MQECVVGGTAIVQGWMRVLEAALAPVPVTARLTEQETAMEGGTGGGH